MSAEFRRFYAEHFAFVWRTLRRFGVPEASLDDAAQDLFVIVHRRFGAWEDSQRAWLYTVARRVASRHHRSRHRHERKLAQLRLVTGGAGPASGGSPERLAGARAELERVAAAVDALEPGRRQVYILMEIEGFSAPEAAEALGCKLNTVYSRLRRARKDMAAALGEPQREEQA